MLALCAAILIQAADMETFNAPGFDVPVSGIRFVAGEATSAMPLGGLGTGFVELQSTGAFGAHVTTNDWLHPQFVAKGSGLQIRIGNEVMDFADTAASGARFWGHFPAADLFLDDCFASADVHLRAFAPLVPHDYIQSNLPVALFTLRVKNSSAQPLPVDVVLRWQPGIAGHAETNSISTSWRGEAGTYALSAAGAGFDRVFGTNADTISVNATREILAGESAELTFALAWHFPSWPSSDGETLRHRYADRFSDAGAVIEKALPQAGDIERAIVAWQSKIYASNVSPWLKDAAINSLYVLPRNYLWLADGRFFQSESFTGCPITETLVCRFNGSFPLALLWPECEKATMAEFVRTQAESGQIAFGFGQPLGTKTPMMHLQEPIVSTEFVLLAWRNYALWKDAAYLREIYPAMKKAMQFALTLDTDGDGLVNEAPGSDTGFPANQYYDVWPWWGTSAYTGSISLAAWSALERAAGIVGDAEGQQMAGQIREKAAAAFDALLWTGEYYRLYNDPAHGRASDTSLTNALCGQWYAYATGLGEIVPRDHIQGTIDTVLRLNDAATAFGAVNGVGPDGGVDESFEAHSAALTIGEVWNFCAMAAFAGRDGDAVRLFEESYRNVAATQASPWNIPWSYNPDTGAIQWGIHYYSNPCLWTLLQALDPTTYNALGR